MLGDERTSRIWGDPWEGSIVPPGISDSLYDQTLFAQTRIEKNTEKHVILLVITTIIITDEYDQFTFIRLKLIKITGGQAMTANLVTINLNVGRQCYR